MNPYSESAPICVGCLMGYWEGASFGILAGYYLGIMQPNVGEAILAALIGGHFGATTGALAGVYVDEADEVKNRNAI